MRNGRLIRCYCCKQLGHAIEHCQLDPNYKTNTQDMTADEIRVTEMSNQKKLNGESYVGMAHLLKKAVMIPNEEK